MVRCGHHPHRYQYPVCGKQNCCSFCGRQARGRHSCKCSFVSWVQITIFWVFWPASQSLPSGVNLITNSIFQYQTCSKLGPPQQNFILKLYLNLFSDTSIMKMGNLVVQFNNQTAKQPTLIVYPQQSVLKQQQHQSAVENLAVLIRLHFNATAQHMINPLLLQRTIRLYLALGSPTSEELGITFSLDQAVDTYVHFLLDTPPDHNDPKSLASFSDNLGKVCDIVYSGDIQFLPRSTRKPWEFLFLQSLRNQYFRTGKPKQARKANQTLITQLKGTFQSRLCKFDDDLAVSVLQKLVKAELIAAGRLERKKNWVGAVEIVGETIRLVEKAREEVKDKLLREQIECYEKMGELHGLMHYSVLAQKYSEAAVELKNRAPK